MSNTLPSNPDELIQSLEQNPPHGFFMGNLHTSEFLNPALVSSSIHIQRRPIIAPDQALSLFDYLKIAEKVGDVLKEAQNHLGGKMRISSSSYCPQTIFGSHFKVECSEATYHGYPVAALTKVNPRDPQYWEDILRAGKQVYYPFDTLVLYGKTATLAVAAYARLGSLTKHSSLYQEESYVPSPSHQPLTQIIYMIQTNDERTYYDNPPWSRTESCAQPLHSLTRNMKDEFGF